MKSDGGLSMGDDARGVSHRGAGKPSHVYDQNAARHYSAYRPPQHAQIVSDALAGRKFNSALDVGCGTGASSLALTEHCEAVVGVDQSAEMLSQAAPHPRVRYVLANGANLPMTGPTFDLVTIAGVLPYLDQGRFVGELQRICRPGALILSYDFKLDLSGVLQLFPELRSRNTGVYDHSKDLSAHPDVRVLQSASRTFGVRLSAEQTAHILLSSSERCGKLADAFGAADPFDETMRTISAHALPDLTPTTIWCATHRLRTQSD